MIYHPKKVNVVVDALSKKTLVTIQLYQDWRRYLIKCSPVCKREILFLAQLTIQSAMVAQIV